MKTTKRLIGVVAIAMALTVVLSAGAAVASRPQPPGPQCENIMTTTNIVCMGTVTEMERLDWTCSDVDINMTLEDEEVTGQIKYNEDMKAMSGYTEFMKDMGIDTCNTPNLDVMKTFGFVGEPTGALSNDESVSMSLISNPKATEEVMLCPFAAAKMDEIPASCEMVSAHSTIVAREVVATTIAEVGTTAAPVSLRYDISATGVGDVAAGRDVFIEGGSLANVGEYTLGTKLSYVERSSASGIWDFSKTMEYVSAIRPTGEIPEQNFERGA